MLKFIYILCGLIECLWISADGNGVRANESITEARENSFFALYFFHWGEIYPSFDQSLKSLLNVRRHGSVLIHWFEHAGTRCRRSRIRRPCRVVVPVLQFVRVSCSNDRLQRDFLLLRAEIPTFLKRIPDPGSSFVAQWFNGIQIGRLDGGICSENDAHQGTDE